MADRSIRMLLLPNTGHQYGNSLKVALEDAGIETLHCDAGWGFELHRHPEVVFKQNPDIVHLQWPESLCRPDACDDFQALNREMEEVLAAIAARGIPIVWTMHNLRPHKRIDARFERELYQHYADYADGVIHHSRSGMRRAQATYMYRRSARHAVIPHGFFDTGPPCTLSQLEARERVGLPQKAAIYMFCGAFRRDKNIDVLVEALGDSSGDLDTVLLMVGQERSIAEALYPELALEYPNIIWTGRLPKEELAVYMQAIDALISAHGDKHLTSAGPHLSQAYLKPQICIEADYASEILGDSAFYFEGGDSIGESLKNRLTTITTEQLREASEKMKRRREAYRWDKIARRTVQFYEEVLHG